MPERDIENLPRGAASTSNSFRVFAEWLRDNRNALERRLDSQDRKLEEIHSETRRTNGRVTTLENNVELGKALEEERQAWESKQTKKATKRESRREKRIQWVVGAILLIVGSVLGNVGQALGWW